MVLDGGPRSPSLRGELGSNLAAKEPKGMFASGRMALLGESTWLK